MFVGFDEWECADTYRNHKYNCCGRQPTIRGTIQPSTTDYQSVSVGPEGSNLGYGSSPVCGGLQEELQGFDLGNTDGDISNTFTRGEYDNIGVTSMASRQGTRKMVRRRLPPEEEVIHVLWEKEFQEINMFHMI